jgi:hypothetical protein
MKKFALGSATLVAIIAVASTANANVADQSNPPNLETGFGQRGQWYLFAPTVDAAKTTFNQSNGASMGPMIGMGIQAGTFVRNRFSLGFAIDGGYGTQKMVIDTSGTTDRLVNWQVALSAVAGWQRPVSSWVSFWPKIKVGGAFGRSDQAGYDPGVDLYSKTRVNNYGLSASVQLPVVLHVTRHLFVEVGWQLLASLGHNAQLDDLRGTGNTYFALGGWL